MNPKPLLKTLIVFIFLPAVILAQTTVLTNVRPIIPPAFLGWDATGVPGQLQIRNDFNFPIIFSTAGTPRMAIRGQLGFNQGFVGINQANPQSRLTVDGNLSVGSNVAAPLNGLRVFGTTYMGGNGTPQGILHIDNNSNVFQLVLESTNPFNPDMTFANNLGVKGQIRYMMGVSPAPFKGMAFAVDDANNTWLGLPTTQLFIDGTNQRIGLGNDVYTPQNRVEIKSEPTDPEPAGLRFTNLISTAVPIVNPGLGVLSIDSDGDVIYVPSGSGFGNLCSNAQIPLPGSFQVPLNNFNYFFSDGAVAGTNINDVAIGLPCSATLFAKLSVFNNFEQIGSFTNSDATNIPIPGGPTPVIIASDGYIHGLNNVSTSAIGVLGVSDNFVSKANIGVQGIAYSGQAENIGVLGNVVFNSTGTGTNYGGYFEATSQAGGANYGLLASAPILPLVNYAAVFNGDINFNGDLYGINNVQLASDQIFKTNIDSITNATGIINQLIPHSYYMDTLNNVGMHFNSAKQYGLVAQEVETILPELVGDASSVAFYDSIAQIQYPSVNYKTLNYNAFIAILIKGMQEQQQQIDSLTSQMNSCCANNARTQNPNINQTDITLTNSESIVLDQNIPNPFAEQTTITYNLPASVQKAQLLFYDATGKLIKAVDLTTRGNGQVNVFANDLSNGIYSYALVVDGQIADTKRMVKTE